MKKTITAFILVLALCMSSVTAFAAPSNEVYIDATQVSQEEIDMLVEEASAAQKTITIDWKDGVVVRLTPETGEQVEPYINVTDTVDLTTSSWKYFGHCDPILIMPSQLKVTNYSQNPGSIDVKIRNDQVIGTYYIYAIAPGYTGEITQPYPYDIYLRACSVSGSYKVKASDWII